MLNNSKNQEKTLDKLVPYKIAGTYLVVAALWILFSDQVSAVLFKDIETLTYVQTLKGGFFVMATAVMLAVLVSYYLKRIHRSQDAIRDSERFLDAIVENIPDMIFVKDAKELRFIRVNRAAEELLGYSRKELLDKGDHDFFPKDEADFFTEKDREVLKNGRILNISEELIQTRNKGERVLNTKKIPLLGKEGKPLYLLGISEDITERKRTEKALKESEEHYRTVFENTGTATIIIEADTTISMANAEFENLSGYSREKLEGKMRWTEFVTREDLERMQEYHDARRTDEEKAPAEYEARFVDKSGAVKNILVKADIIPGTPKSIASLTDITHRRQAEEELKRVNRALNALSKFNEALVRATDEPDLLQDACRIIVDAGGYILAWVGLAEDDEKKSVRPAAHRGFDDGYLESLDITWADTEQGRGPTGTAIRTGEPSIARDIIKDPGMTPWRKEAARRGYKSSIALPLTSEGRSFGALNIYAGESEAFDEEELSLLKELADDLAYGIVSLRARVEHRMAEEALKESEERFRTVAQTAKDAIITINSRGDVVFWNQEAKRIFGYSSDEITGRPITLIMSERFHEKHHRGMERLAKTGKSDMVGKTVEKTGQRRDGTEFPMELSLAAWGTKEGDFYTGIVRDITERKQAEKKLKGYSENLERMVDERTQRLNQALFDMEQARDRIDGILKSVADGLIVTDARNRVVLMNRAAENLLGVRFPELMDRPIDIAVKDETLREELKKTPDKTGGHQFDFELPGDVPDHPRIMRARTSIIHDKAGEESGIVTIIHDVTHEREVDRMKTDFLSTAAHEIRTPLTSVQGFSEIMMMRNDLSPEERNKYLGYINKQSKGLAKIINDLLDISRIESGIGFSLERVWCAAGEGIKETVPYFQEQSEKHRFEVTLPGDDVKLFIDKDKMGQVLKNLVSNAIKYSPDGGLIRISGAALQDEYRIAVEDEGIGMTPEQVEQVFDKFYRANTSETAVESTGLGMNIVKLIVEAHGGRVWVNSEFGKGTKVTFTIPLQP